MLIALLSFAIAHQHKTDNTINSKPTTPSRPSISYDHVNNLEMISSDHIFCPQRTIDDQAAQRITHSKATIFDFGKIAIQPKLKVTQPSDPYEQEAGRVTEQIMVMPSVYDNVSMSDELLNSGVVQTKLRVSQPGDIYEEEADRVAEQVMRVTNVQENAASLSTTNDEIVSRKCQSCQEEEETEMNISRKSNDGDRSKISENVGQHVTDAILTGGSPLESTTRYFMESRFGFDFGNIRIHTDEGSARSARAMNALAYTVGNNIIFETGRYEPNRPDGMKLLAHELVHAIQQTKSAAGRINPKANNARAKRILGSSQEFGMDELEYAGITNNHINHNSPAKQISNSATLIQRVCKDHSDENFYAKASNYCRDTGFTGLLHPGRTCYREVPRRTGYWECPPGDQVCFGTDGSCEDSYDNASPVEKKASDGSCNLHGWCAWTHHALKDVIAEALEPFGRSIGEQQMTCHEICETQPLPLRGFCLAGCSPMGMGPM